MLARSLARSVALVLVPLAWSLSAHAGPKQGVWQPPIDIGISCDTCCAGAGTSLDEIVHVNLIPVGPHAGSLMLWTRCDLRGPGLPTYHSYIWDPQANIVKKVSWPAALDTGTFCAGQCWVFDPLELDSAGDPKLKLLIAGGRRQLPSGGFEGSSKVLAFDPYDVEWDLATWPSIPSSPSLGDLRGWYYPSLIPLPDNMMPVTDPYQVLLVGGSRTAANTALDCLSHDATNDPVLPNHWYSLSTSVPAQLRLWTRMGPFANGYRWHQYPRLFVLSTDKILQAGHAVTCESGPTTSICSEVLHDPDPGVGLDAMASPCDLGFGQFPTRIIDAASVQPTDPNDPAHPNAGTLAPINPEAQLLGRWKDAIGLHSRNVGAWHYCNGAILHTLKPDWAWPVGNEAPGSLSEWNVDRVFVTGGVYKNFPIATGGVTPTYYGIMSCLEYDSASKTWMPKCPPNRARALGSSAVILPTRELLLLGGLQNNADVYESPNRIPDLFDPEEPLDSGTWTGVKERYSEDNGNPDGPDFYPRGYHSAAILLPSGEVSLMGGREFSQSASSSFKDSRDIAENYRPDYMNVPVERPFLDQAPSVINYPSPSSWNALSVKTDDPASISHAALIGVGSVTHHFDYGQRLIELPVKTTSSSTALRIIPPPNDRLAPPGYYLLFLIKQGSGTYHNGLIPSQGRFVRVDY